MNEMERVLEAYDDWRGPLDDVENLLALASCGVTEDPSASERRAA